MWPVYLLRLLALVACLVGLVLLVGTFLPRSFHVEQRATIAAPRAAVYAQLADLRHWLAWSPWSQVAEDARIVATDGEFADAVHWSDPRGAGKLWVVSRSPAERVEFRLTLAQFQEVGGRIELQGDNPTEVRWTLVGRFPPGPFYGYFRFFFPAEMRNQMARSLERLRTRCVEPPRSVPEQAVKGQRAVE